MKTIELDCAPGMPRPDSLIGGVVKGTALEGKLGETVSRVFGCWTWDFSSVSDEDWQAAQAVVKPRIVALYQQNRIRYGSW